MIDSIRQVYRRGVSLLIAIVCAASSLRRKLAGICGKVLSHCLFSFWLSILEEVNNQIKVIKRMAYGFSDDEYFFMRFQCSLIKRGMN